MRTRRGWLLVGIASAATVLGACSSPQVVGSNAQPMGAQQDLTSTGTATAPTAVPTTPISSGGSASSAVYVENDRSGPVQKLTEFMFYEHTGMSGIVWSSWGGQTAQGDGDLTDNDCNPDCASGHMNKFRAHIVLSDIQTVNGKREYTRYTVTFDGQNQNPDLARALTNQPTTPSSSSNGPSTSAPQFPNKTLNVVLTGYNSSAQMVQFQLAVFQGESSDNGMYVPDPSNPGTHQLPLAANATVLSAAVYCPPDGPPTIGADGVGNGPCSVAQFLAALQNKPSLGAARIVVDGTDHISKVSEIYHP